MNNSHYSPSRVALFRANAKTEWDAQKEKKAAIRAAAGLTGNQLIKLKPLSEELTAKIAAFHASGRFGRQ